MFLRAESFDARKAAKRMVKYFESKQLLFGKDKLVKRITYADLDADDKGALLSGGAQILRSKDQSGRTIFFISGKLGSFKTWQNQVRKRLQTFVWCAIAVPPDIYSFSD